MISPNAVTSMGLVLADFIDKVKGEYKDVNLIYDEEQTLESSLTKIRAKREREQQQGGSEFPLFSFKRSMLKFPEHGMGRRSQTTRLYHPTVTEEGQQNQKPTFYKAIYGRLDVPFMYCIETLRDEEIFEIEFMAEDHISSIKQLDVEIPDLGVFQFFAQYSPIEEKTVHSKDIYYKVVQGTVSFTGWYIVLEGQGNIITQINAKIKQFNELVLSDINIVANT